MTTAERILGNAEAGVDYVKQLAFENANPVCQAAVRSYRKKTDLTGYIRLCSDIGPSYQQGLGMVAVMQGQSVRDFLASRDKKACFKCGKPRHFAKDCRVGNQSPLRWPRNQPELCMGSKLGKHWANKCRSKTEKQGKTLFPNKGNGSRGQPQALNQHKPKQVYGVVSFMPASNNNPFQNLI